MPAPCQVFSKIARIAAYADQFWRVVDAVNYDFGVRRVLLGARGGELARLTFRTVRTIELNSTDAMLFDRRYGHRLRPSTWKPTDHNGRPHSTVRVGFNSQRLDFC